MFDIAHTVRSCLRAGTVVHVAWLVGGAPFDPSEAVALTPGGGRTGSLLAGAVDHVIADALTAHRGPGGLIRVPVGPVEALLTGRPEGTELVIAFAAGSAFPHELWEELAARRPVTFGATLDNGRFVDLRLLEPSGTSEVELTDDELITSLAPVPRVVISGSGPIAEALSRAFALAEWQADVIADVTAAAGLMSTLSGTDAVIVMGHDVEIAGRALEAAIGSRAGYIGSIGSNRMQQLRQDWLAYRGVQWDARVHGPAGFPINPSNPGEIAVSIVAEAISSLRSFGEPPPGL
jgi:xanthine/CO dehydrogenase XdhC/CoxF family maturation factor